MADQADWCRGEFMRGTRLWQSLKKRDTKMPPWGQSCTSSINEFFSWGRLDKRVPLTSSDLLVYEGLTEEKSLSCIKEHLKLWTFHKIYFTRVEAQNNLS